MMVKTFGPLLASSLAFFLSSEIASAADLPPEPVEVSAESGWTFTVAPYLWMAGMNGDIAQFGLPEVEVDASFGDILKNFDIGAMAVAEARYESFGIFTDFEYVKLSADADTPRGILADKIDVTSKTLTVMAAGSFRLLESETGSFDILAGGRLWSVRTDVDLKGGLIDDASFNDEDTWVDPVIGAKGRADLTEEIYITAWGMVGGFGVASDLSWDVMGAIGYSFSDSFSMVGGYRALSVDYQNGDFVFDVVQHGPLLGAVFRF